MVTDDEVLYTYLPGWCWCDTYFQQRICIYFLKLVLHRKSHISMKNISRGNCSLPEGESLFLAQWGQLPSLSTSLRPPLTGDQRPLLYTGLRSLTGWSSETCIQGWKDHGCLSSYECIVSCCYFQPTNLRDCLECSKGGKKSIYSLNQHIFYEDELLRGFYEIN